MTVPSSLDHIVFAGPSLSEAVELVASLTGVTPVLSGRHPAGTANALIALTVGGVRGPQYLEVIGPDADRGFTQDQISNFGIAALSAPKLVSFAVHPDDIRATAASAHAAGLDLGEVYEHSRDTPDGGTLRWSLTRPLAVGPASLVPFLIDWGSSAHPGLADLPVLELASLVAETPDRDALRRDLTLVGVEAEIVEAQHPGLVAILVGPRGTVELR